MFRAKGSKLKFDCFGYSKRNVSHDGWGPAQKRPGWLNIYLMNRAELRKRARGLATGARVWPTTYTRYFELYELIADVELEKFGQIRTTHPRLIASKPGLDKLWESVKEIKSHGVLFDWVSRAIAEVS